MTTNRFYELFPDLLAGHAPFALAVLTGVKGSSPQKIGAKAVFLPDGRIIGTLGGGCLEAEVQDRARRALLTQTPAQFDLVLDHIFGWDDGLICGGKVSGLILPQAAQAGSIWRELAECARPRTWGVSADYRIEWAEDRGGEWLYRETVSPPCALWIAGSGHIAQAVAPLALQLDFAVTVFDDRPALANPQFFPQKTSFRTGYWEDLLEEPLPERPAFGLIVTRGHQHDARVLQAWIQRPFEFLGMIGSRRKVRVIREHFLTEGLATDEQFARVACPVGLAIQAQSVQEIAVSILAQYVQERAEMNQRAIP